MRDTYREAANIPHDPQLAEAITQQQGRTVVMMGQVIHAFSARAITADQARELLTNFAGEWRGIHLAFNQAVQQDQLPPE
jgi:hypothetical protein